MSTGFGNTPQRYIYMYIACLVVYSIDLRTATSYLNEQSKLQAATMKRMEISNFVPVVG